MLLKKIQLFPIKSLDGIQVQQTAITKGQSLALDRRWALHRLRDGRTVNGKKYPAIHQLRARYELEQKKVYLTAPKQGEEAFVLAGDFKALNAYFSEYFGEAVALSENKDRGFPDHTSERVGASLVSVETLEQVGRWFGLSLEEVSRRMRMNFIVETTAAFAEDGLLTQDAENPIAYNLGKALIYPYKPCVRCPVPTRDSKTGEVIRSFQKEYMQRRLALQPHLLEHALYKHAYMCGIILQISSQSIGKNITVGDSLQLRS